MDFNYFIIGLNHKSADLSLRERVSIPESKILQAQHQLKKAARRQYPLLENQFLQYFLQPNPSENENVL